VHIYRNYNHIDYNIDYNNSKGDINMVRVIRKIFRQPNLNGNLACKRKNCINKKQNGRCSLKEIRFDKYKICIDFIEKGSINNTTIVDKEQEHI